LLAEASPKGGVILDIGCERGFFSHQSLGANWEWFGIESFHLAEERTASDLPSMNAITLQRYSRQSFDCVCSFDVIEHTPSPMHIFQA